MTKISKITVTVEFPSAGNVDENLEHRHILSSFDDERENGAISPAHMEFTDLDQHHVIDLTLRISDNYPDFTQIGREPLSSPASCCKGNTPAHSGSCTTSASEAVVGDKRGAVMKTIKHIKLYVEAATKLVFAAMSHPNTEHVIKFYDYHIEVTPQSRGPIALGAGKGSHA
jgi:hypothetical protein